MDMMELQQLSVRSNKDGFTKENIKAPQARFNKLILDIALAKPLWNFEVTRVRAYEKTVQVVKVYQHGEELGYIEWDYFRGEYGFEIGNDRIERARERTSSYKTHDEKKAFAAIKKTFSPKNTGERINEAVKQAEKLVNNEAWEKAQKHRSTKSTYNEKALEFVAGVPAMFYNYLKDRNELHVLEKHQEAELEMQTLQDLQQKLGACSVVIKVDGGYIVKTGDKIETLTDTTLPDHMKAKLGMLKLVDDEHFITNIGGKVKADVFVLTPEEGEAK